MSIINKIILGTVQFGLEYGINNTEGLLPEEKIFKILGRAYDLGIRKLDSAEAYGNAHHIIHKFHKQTDIRFEIITKFSSSYNSQFTDLVDRVQDHCTFLQVDRLYSYMFHSYADFKTQISKDNQLLSRLKESRFIKKIGVSLYTNEELVDVLKYEEIELIQIPFNLLDNDLIRKEVLESAQQKHIEVHTRSSFLQGLFFKDPTKLLGNLKELQFELCFLNELIVTKKLKTSTLALTYPLQKTYINNVLIGVDSIEQLEENISEIKTVYEADIYNQIDKIECKIKERLNPSTWKQ